MQTNGLKGGPPAPETLDLNAIVEKWAWDMYRETAASKYKKLLSRHENKLTRGKKLIDVHIDWTDVKFRDITKWPRMTEEMFAEEDKTIMENKDEETKPQAGKPNMSILFRTRFTNDTEKEQEYTMKTEKTTRSSCSTEVETGFTKGMEMSVKLAAPGEIFEANAGYHREYSLTDVDGQSFEEEVTWGVESTIHVEKLHVAEAQLVVNEKRYTGDFQVKTKLTGSVHVTFNNIKDNNSLIIGVTGDVTGIFENMKNKPNWVQIQGSSVFITTKGTCAFRYGVKQEVVVKQIPINKVIHKQISVQQI